MKQVTFIVLMFVVVQTTMAQRVPSLAENIEYLVTFSKASPPSWGDDDHTQIYFISISKNSKSPFYIRVYDADVGGALDMPKGTFDSETRFAVFGGKGAYSNEASRKVNPTTGYDDGMLIQEQVVGDDAALDQKWMTLGPFNPREGEFDATLDAYIFKLIIEGGKGNDGNLYNFFISAEANANEEVMGSNAFCYEMSFRVPTGASQISHIYPFIDGDVIKVKVHNFDFDNGGGIRITSVAKKSHPVSPSGDGDWVTSIHDVSDKERNTSYDLHILDVATFANDMTIFVTNQYDQSLPFFAKPVNGIPKYDYKPSIVKVGESE